MSQERMLDNQDERLLKEEGVSQEEAAPEFEPVVSPAMGADLLSKPMSGVQRRAVVQNVAQNFGNKSVQRMLGVARKSASAGAEGGSLEDNIASRIQSERSNGQTMDAGLRRQVEQNLGGADLSQVRVHTGPTAEDLNQQVGAKAFTTGRDIFYGSGASPSDLELTTHEATHTIQQGMSEDAPSSVGAADTAHEQAADHAAAGGLAQGVQREAAGEEEEMARKLDPSIQREGPEEEEEVQREVIQREGPEEEEELQA